MVRCVVCVWLCNCFWVSLCVCLSVYVFVIICVYIYPVSLPVCFMRCPTKWSPCALYMCVFLRLSLPPPLPRCSGVRVPLVFLFMSICVCPLKTPARLCWTPQFFSSGLERPWRNVTVLLERPAAEVLMLCVQACFLREVRSQQGASDQQSWAPLQRGSGIRAKP